MNELIPMSKTAIRPFFSLNQNKRGNSVSGKRIGNKNFIVRLKNNESNKLQDYADNNGQQASYFKTFKSNREENEIYRKEFQYAPDGSLYINPTTKDYFMLGFDSYNNNKSSHRFKRFNKTTNSRFYLNAKLRKENFDTLNTAGISIQFMNTLKSSEPRQTQTNFHTKECERFHNNWKRQRSTDNDNRSQSITQHFLENVNKINNSNNIEIKTNTKRSKELNIENFAYHSYLKHRKGIGCPYGNFNASSRVTKKLMSKQPAIRKVEDVINVKESDILNRTVVKEELANRAKNYKINETTIAQALNDKYESLYEKYKVNSDQDSRRPLKPRVVSEFTKCVAEICRNKKKKVDQFKTKVILPAKTLSQKPKNDTSDEKFFIGPENKIGRAHV